MTESRRPTDFSVLEYLYRDAGNFKTHGSLLLTGDAAGAEAAVLRCLDWRHQFVAEQAGIRSLCPDHWESVGEGPSHLDHAYHEFVRLRAATAEELSLPPVGSLQALVERLQAAATRWDVTLSPHCCPYLIRLERGSMRINDQWRVCFRWKDGDAHDVEIVDYH